MTVIYPLLPDDVTGDGVLLETGEAVVGGVGVYVYSRGHIAENDDRYKKQRKQTEEVPKFEPKSNSAPPLKLVMHPSQVFVSELSFVNSTDIGAAKGYPPVHFQKDGPSFLAQVVS